MDLKLDWNWYFCKRISNFPSHVDLIYSQCYIDVVFMLVRALPNMKIASTKYSKSEFVRNSIQL